MLNKPTRQLWRNSFSWHKHIESWSVFFPFPFKTSPLIIYWDSQKQEANSQNYLLKLKGNTIVELTLESAIGFLQQTIPENNQRMAHEPACVLELLDGKFSSSSNLVASYSYTVILWFGFVGGQQLKNNVWAEVFIEKLTTNSWKTTSCLTSDTEHL